MSDIKCESLLYPLRVVYNSKIGMRGQMGVLGPTGAVGPTEAVGPSEQKNCHESINIYYGQINCDLCDSRISERQFLFCHKINRCSGVTECKKCLGYISNSGDTHICQDIKLEEREERSSIMPLVRLQEDGTVILQIGRMVMKSLTSIRPKKFKVDDKDETFTTTFELPEYKLKLFYHKRIMACGDSTGLRWNLNDALPGSYVSELFPNVDSLINASHNGVRLVFDRRITCLSTYENIEMDKR